MVMDEQKLFKSVLQVIEKKTDSYLKGHKDAKEAETFQKEFSKEFAKVLQLTSREIFKPQSPSLDALRVAEEQAIEEYDYQLDRTVQKRKRYPKYIQTRLQKTLKAEAKALKIMAVDNEHENTNFLIVAEGQNRGCPTDIPELTAANTQIKTILEKLQTLPDKVDTIEACNHNRERCDKKELIWKSSVCKSREL